MADVDFLSSLLLDKKGKSKKSSSAASLFNNAGLSLGRSNFAVKTASNESFSDLMGRIGSIQSSAKILKALGKKPKDKQREGLLTKLLGQETGILTAPARAVTAFAADVFGLPFDDETAKEALKEYGPFEAAFRSARGEFAITGGDIFRVQEDDDFPTRLAKWGGALAFDIATDPISWLGTLGGPLSRKSVAALAVREGESMLAPMSKALANNGIDATRVIDTLFESSLTGQKFNLGEEGIVRQITDAAGAVKPDIKMRVAGTHFGSLIGSNLYRFGRDGITRGLTELFVTSGAKADVAEKAAKEFIETLPKELGTETAKLISGGLYLKTPFRGKPIVRLAGGKGEGNIVSNVANEALFRASASSSGQFFSRNFQGRYGKAWAETKKAMIPGVPLKAPLDKDTLLTYVSFKDEMAKFGRDSRKFTSFENEVATRAQAVRNGITDKDKAAYYENQLIHYFWHPAAPVSVNTELADRLAEGTAKRIADAELEELDAIAKMVADSFGQHLNAARDLKVAAGFSVRNLGEQWRPLMFRDDVYEALRVSGALKGPEELRYSPNISRTQEIEYIPDEELAKLRGFKIDKDVTALSPKAANDEIGEVTIGEKKFQGLYEEDPTKAMLKYLHEVHNAVTHKRLIDALELTGTISVLPSEVRKQLNERNAASFIASLGSKAGVTSKIVARAEQMLDQTEKEFKAAIDQAEVSRVQQDVMQRITNAETQVAAIDAQIDAATANLRAARQAARQARPTVPSAQRVLQEYGQSGVEQSVEEAQRVARNAAARTTKATRKAETTAAEANELAADAALPVYDPNWSSRPIVAKALLPEAQQAAAAAQQKLAVEEVTLAGARNELNFAKQLRQDILNELGPAQVERFNIFEEALQLQVRAAEELDNLRSLRRIAVNELRAASADTTFQRAARLESVVNVYVTYRRRFLETAAETGRRFTKKPEELAKMTPEARAAYENAKLTYETAKALHERAKKLLFSVLEYSTRKKTTGIGREYAAKIVQLADRMSTDQFRLTMVIADGKRLEEFADSLAGLRLSSQMQVVGDMVQSYKTIRELITKEDLTDLSMKQRSVLHQVDKRGEDALTLNKLRESELQRQLFVEDEFMRVGAKGGAKIPSSLRDVWTTKGVRGVLEDIYRLHGDQTEWEKFVARIYDPAALVWRVAATVGRGPAFVMNNTVGGHANNFLGGVSVRDHAISAKMLSTTVETIRKAQKDNPNVFPDELIDKISVQLEKKMGKIKIGDKSVADLYIEFFERGGHFDTDTFFHREQLLKTGLSTKRPTRLLGNITVEFTDEPVGKAESSYRRIIKSLLDNRVQTAFSDLAQASEIYLRFAAFVSGYRRFGNLDSAMDLTYMLHFNYQDLAGAEVWVKRFIPFYTWARNNVPLQLRATFLSPDRMGKLVKANEEFQRAMAADEDAQWLNDYLPEWMQLQNGFASYFTFGGNHLALFNKLPMADVDRMFEVRYIGTIPFPVPRTREFVNMLGPVGKTTIEWLTNRNFEYGYEYSSIGDKLRKTVENNVPYLNTGRRFASTVGFDVDRERRISNMFGLLVGTPYGLTVLNEKTINSAAFGRQMELSAQAKKAAADAGIDYKWLQTRIKKGDSLQDLVIRISKGEGNAVRLATGKQITEFIEELEGKQKKQKRDYGAVSEGLRTGKLITGF